MLQLKKQSTMGGGNNLKLFQEIRRSSGAVRLQVEVLELQRTVKPLIVKKCACARNGICPLHVNYPPPPPPLPPPPPPPLPLEKNNVKLRTNPSVTRPRTVNSNREDELKLSLSSLTTTSQTELDPVASAEKENIFARWLSEKKQARRLLEQERALLEQAIRAERQNKIELERRNFESWLQRKIIEDRQRKEREAREQEERKHVEEQEQLRKKLENQLSYALWLKRAEQRQLEEQLRIETEKVKEVETRRQRLQQNSKAYERWLSDARSKPRPLPLNQGLDSLRASISVSYVNPTPWEPNVKPTTK